MVVEPNIIVLDGVTSFTQNFNIMFVVQLLLLLISLTLFLLSKAIEGVDTFFAFFQKEAMLIIVFNTPIILFAASLIDELAPFEIAIAGVSLALLLGQIVHLLWKYKFYMSFDVTFDLQKSNFRVYFIGLMVSRMLPPALCGSLRAYTFSGSAMLFCLQAVACIFFTVLRIFKYRYSNAFSLAGDYALLVFLGINEVFIFQRDSGTAHFEIEMILSWVQIALFLLLAVLALGCASTALCYECFSD